MSTYSLEQRAAAARMAEQQMGETALLPGLGSGLPVGWYPNTKMQEEALQCMADILFLGGSAGSLKTESLLVDAAMERDNPNLRGIIFRQAFTEMTDIVDKTRKLYLPMGARYVGQPNWMWTFPSGGTIRLAIMDNDGAVDKYLGPRYSWIGFDESTFHTEYQIRNILGRLASTDKRLRLRMRLASNPGHVGAAFHKKMFLRGACPVHEPDKCAVSGRLYYDAVWPSDKYPLRDKDGHGFSIAFIPGRLTDHNLLDEKYVYRLRMMSGGLAKAMEQGCWCKLEGAYFSHWDQNKMIIPYASIQEHWWDTHFISIDYGFGKSSAAAYLHVRLQTGQIRTIAEIVESKVPAVDFGKMVADAFVKPLYQGQQRRVCAVFLDPSNFKDIGDGHTIADQLQDQFASYNIGVIRASNDRAGRWQLMYTDLKTGNWAVADTCPKLCDAIPSRMHDPKKTGDIIKVIGDPLDDAMDCAGYGLYSFTNVGEMPAHERAMEAIKGIPKEDVTSRMVFYQKAIEEAKPKPVAMGRRGAYNVSRLRGRRR
jgi:hypothetical protein